MKIIPLMEDYCPSRGLHGEHGLSMYIETGSARILFDAGQTDAFIENARQLGVELGRVDAVFLSHGHYDHSGGIAALYASMVPARPPLYAGPGYSIPKFARNDSVLTANGIPDSARPPVSPPAIELSSRKEIVPGIHALPHVERADGSVPAPRFRLVENGAERLDGFDDEVSLVFDEPDGLVVVTGCAHRGIVNIVEAAIKAIPGKPVAAVVGGFHLVDAPEDTIAAVADAMERIGPVRILCGHCTGPRAYAALYARLPGRVSWLSCGQEFTL
jgi:7,8-dihydropterin-6-yl-methyl-4-(beta-D-ribofuranosyl)aminobenzene 5'-phosphate synthase